VTDRYLTTQRKISRLMLGTVLGAATLFSGCKKAAEETSTPEVTVQAEKVAQGDLTEYITGSTVFSPLAQAAIVPKISAPIQRFLVQRGAHVRKGQLLGVLENRDLSASVVDTRGALSQADAAFDTTTKAQVVEDRKKAQLDVQQTKANLDLAKIVNEARQNLFKEGRSEPCGYGQRSRLSARHTILPHIAE